MKKMFDNILARFGIEGSLTGFHKLTNGNINDTYVLSVRTKNNNRFCYVAQRINDYVFKEPEKVMENIISVTRHLSEQIEAQGGDSSRETLNFYSSDRGQYCCRCDDGTYWRICDYIDGARTYQTVHFPEQFYNAGKAYGKFLRLLTSYPVETLHVTIPDFHNTPARLRFFMESVKKDIENRSLGVRDEIDFIMSKADMTSTVSDLMDNGNIPFRVTHNDTKLDNVLIDTKTKEGITVIDLDTVMPGSSLYDFGDAIRSGANIAGEEERDLSKIHLDLNLVQSYTQGYMEEAGAVLNPIEKEYLAFSSKLLTLELAMRFLTDYINGDVYYKIAREDHNLHRARVQLKLLSDMEENYGCMKNIVENCCNNP